VGALIWLGT